MSARPDLTRSVLRRVLAVLLLCSWVLPALVAAQDTPPSPATDAVLDNATVETRLAELAADTSLESGQRTQLVEIWTAVQERLESARRASALDADYDRRAAEAPERLASLRAAWEQGSTDAWPEPPADAGLEDLISGQRLAASELERRQAALTAVEERLVLRTERRTLIPRKLAELRAAVAEPAPSVGEDPLLAPARKALSRATTTAREAELSALEAERLYAEATGELIALERDLADRERVAAQAWLELWNAAVTRARASEAEAALTAARELARRVPRDLSALAAMADRVVQLGERRLLLASEAVEVRVARTDLDADQALVQEMHGDALRRIEAAGYTHSVSLMLRRQRALLPGYRRHELSSRDLAPRSDALHLEILDWEIDRRKLSRLDDEVAALLALEETAAQRGGRPALTGLRRQAAEALARDVTSALRRALDPLVREADSLFNQMADLEVSVALFAAGLDNQIQFIDEHVLWVRSSGALSLSDLLAAAEGLTAPPPLEGWATLWHQLVVLGAERPGDVGWSVGLAVLLLLARFLAGTQLKLVGAKASGRRTRPVGPSVLAAGLTLVRASTWPGLALLLGPLLAGLDGPPFAQLLGEALPRMAPALLAVSLMSEACRPLGLTEVHLRWGSVPVRSVRRQVRLVQLLILPALLLVLCLEAGEGHELRDSLGRLALMVVLLGLLFLGRNLLGSKAPVLAALRASTADGYLMRVRGLWSPLLVGVPMVLMGAVAYGFGYAGLQVGLAMIHTWLLVVLLVGAYLLALRWLSAARLRMRLEQAQRRRDVAAGSESRSLEMSGEIQAVLEEGGQERDVAALSEQARRVLNSLALAGFLVGLGIMWADLLPALGALANVSLWTSTSAAPEGGAGGLLVNAITLGDVLLAVLVLALTTVAARNLPGLLEMSVLRRMSLEPGGGYTVTTLCRYVITVAGVIIAAGLVGLTWGNVQWLAAAITVGLGFGLQEIFANFVSGLIILFERPVRVGDIVTVGGIEGVVTRIQTRATTIRDRDRRELLVPNREFITGQLVNWTLTDPISRLIIPVGIAYGSNTDLAEATLLEVAQGCRQVLENPMPGVIFRAFGDSTLDYELRVFIADRDFWPQVTHELNTAIHARFAEVGIEIAFPQRDIHVRTMGPGVARGLAGRRPVTD